jgi:hypothetical protein
MTHYQFYTLLAAICAARFFPRWLSAIGCVLFGVMAYRGWA